MPPVETAKQQAIEAIRAGRTVLCSPENYLQGVLAAIVRHRHGYTKKILDWLSVPLLK